MGRRVESTRDLVQSVSVIADYANPASLDEAFEGVDRAFIVSGYAEPVGERSYTGMGMSPCEWHAGAYKGIMVNKTCPPATAVSLVLTLQTKTNDKFVARSPDRVREIFTGLENCALLC